MSEQAALSLLLWAILQWGRGWKRGEGRGGYCTTLSQGDPPHRGLPKLAQPSVCCPLPCPQLPRGSVPTGGCSGPPTPQSPPRSPGHLLSLSSPHSSPRQMLQLFSLFRLQQKPLQAHKGEEQKRGLGLNKSHLPGARAPPCNRGAAPQAAPLRRAHCPAAKKILGTLISRR